MIEKQAYSTNREGRENIMEFTKEFTEEYQVFLFDDESWNVLKYDGETAYKDRIQKLQGTKAMDFVGIHDRDLFLIEVKDFREYSVENEWRLTSGNLAMECGQKVRDTVAGIIGAYRTTDIQKWGVFAKALVNTNSTIKVAIWLRYDLPRHNKQREKVRANVEANMYKKQLNWLTSRVLVTGQDDNYIPDLQVRNLLRVQKP